jgi:hypothetical protein
MANGDLTKTTEYDKIEIVNNYSIQVRRSDVVWEEGSSGALTELSRGFHRHVLQPFTSVKADDDSWSHTATDISGEDAQVQAIANAAWSDANKELYKTTTEAARTI